MSNHPIDDLSPDERRARTECQALMARLQSVDHAGDRLQRVRHAIASGEFQVDAHAIAERLIARLLVS